MANINNPDPEKTKEMAEKQMDELVITIIRSLDHYSSLASKESLSAPAQILQRAKQEIAYWSTDTDYREIQKNSETADAGLSS